MTATVALHCIELLKRSGQFWQRLAGEDGVSEAGLRSQQSKSNALEVLRTWMVLSQSAKASQVMLRVLVNWVVELQLPTQAPWSRSVV